MPGRHLESASLSSRNAGRWCGRLLGLARRLTDMLFVTAAMLCTRTYSLAGSLPDRPQAGLDRNMSMPAPHPNIAS